MYSYKPFKTIKNLINKKNGIHINYNVGIYVI